jgi:predicted ATPase/DNA-binding SARP family transcriptional activator
MVPVSLTALLGRQRELEQAAALLSRTRLLTLTGAGGSGKTRLALELARRDGREVTWVELAPVSDPGLVPQQILSALELPEPPARDVLTVVVDALRERTLLLVLDNCEHLVDACAAVAEAILRQCPSVSILTTTREALGITGEQTWLVPPLDQRDAVELFAERARAVLPAFSIEPHNADDVRRICRRLDGIPLAIELAAARAKVLPIAQIAQRLDNAFSLLAAGSRTIPRHRTIRATIEWSYRLISPEEQIVFRRLAVFAGTFSIDAAEAVCGGDVLGVLSALVDKSLVLCDRSAGSARYRLLETVRQFALEKLGEAGERELVRDRHARFFLALAEAAEPRVFAGASDPPTLLRLDEEIANLRAAIDAEELPAELELRFAYALDWYWFARAHFHEARTRVERALRRAAGVDPVVRARALVAAGNAAAWQGDFAAIRGGIDEAVDALRGSGDDRAFMVALILRGIALALTSDGDQDAAKRDFDESIAIARRRGRDVGLAFTLYWSGVAAQRRLDWSAARDAFAEAHAIGVDTGNNPATAHPLTALGWTALAAGTREEALAAFRRSLELHAEVDDRWGLTQAVEGIAWALLTDAKPGERLLKLLAAAEAAWLRLGARPGRPPEFEAARDELVRRALADERMRVVIASGSAMQYEEMVDLARQVAGAPAAAARPPHSPLRVLALGPLEIYRDDARVDGASQSARASELLLYLLCNPKGVTKEQAGAALWPEADPARLRNNFHVTMHRLRKTFGDCVVVQNDVYAPARGIEFDVAELQRDPRRALDLYRGDFFENASSEWAEQMRERLRDQYAGALADAGRAHIAAGEFAKAAEVYQRLWALDEFDEQAVRQLMTCYGKLGDSGAAARVYRRLCEALRRELQAEPDPATTKIYQRISSS